MVIVRQPLYSGWASGSIAKTITCRAMGHQRFCMHKFRHTQKRRSPAQIWAQERFARKAWIYRNFIRTSWYRSAILNRGACGITICGADNMVHKMLSEMLPIIKEE